MNSLYAALKFGGSTRYYVAQIGFGRPAPRAPVAAGLGNAAFLPEEQVAAAFARLSGLSATEAVEVLRGERRVEEVPALDYCVPIKRSQRTVVDGVYYYSLPNGIHLVGLDESHEAVQRLRRGEAVAAVEFSGELTESLCTTKGSKKRSRRQGVASGVACLVHMPDPRPVALPAAVRQFDVVEANTRLVEEPGLLARPDEGWIVMLMDKRRTARQPKHRRG